MRVSFEVIPVLDLRGGVVVHARAGRRHEYQPLQSQIANGPDPAGFVSAVRSRFGLTRYYVADLDAIEGTGSNLPVVAALARDPQVSLLVDAGAADVGAVRQVLAAGAAHAIIGSETLRDLEALEAMLAAVPASRLVFSLDVKDGRVLSRCDGLRASTPKQVAARVAAIGMPALIVLELARVGTGLGPDVPFLTAVRQAARDAVLIAGGGIRGVHDLSILAGLGFAGALVGTALTSGALPPDVLARWRAGDGG